MSFRRNRLLGLAAALAGATVCNTSVAQTDIDEVVVTAQRREQNVQEVPLAVSAVSGAQLEADGVRDVLLLSGRVPSLVAQPGLTAGRNLPYYAIRAQSQQEGTMLADPSVTVYFNDIAQPRSQGSKMSFFDIASVEVVKGPQGTLFGRNTTGGAILIRPQKPKHEFEASIAQSYGNYGTAVTDAMLNTPIGEGTALRLAGQYSTSDGWLTDTITGKKVNDVDEFGLRAGFDIHTSDNWNSLFTVNYAKANNGGTGGYLTDLPALVSAGLRALQTPLLNAQRARGFYETASGVPMYAKIETFSIDNTTTVNVREGLTIKNILGYRDVDYDVLEDTDGSPSLILTVERIDKQHQISEEFQLLGENGKLNWIAGLFYFNESGSNYGNSAGTGTGTGTADPGAIEPNLQIALYAPRYSSTASLADNTSYAVFGQGSYKLNDRWTATLGLRQNWDKREATILNRGFLNPPAVNPAAFACRFTLLNGSRPAVDACALPLSKSFSELTYNVGFEFKPTDDALLYLAHRHGYRTGGFGARATTEAGLARAFKPEIVDDIELGAKVDWRVGQGTLRTNLAVYFADYKDIQRLLTDPTLVPITTVTTNAGKAKVEGAELEVTWRPTDWLELGGFYAYTDADFTNFIAPDGTDLSTAPFARAPRNMSGVNAKVKLPIAENLGKAAINFSFQHMDRFASSDTFDPTAIVENYDLANLNIAWNGIGGSGFDASIFVDNLFDAKYLLPFQQIAQINKVESPGAPQTYGLRVRYRFGADK